MADPWQAHCPIGFLEVELAWDFQPVRFAFPSWAPESGPIFSPRKQRAQGKKSNGE